MEKEPILSGSTAAQKIGISRWEKRRIVPGLAPVVVKTSRAQMARPFLAGVKLARVENEKIAKFRF